MRSLPLYLPLILAMLPASAKSAEDTQTITRRFSVQPGPEIAVAIVTGDIRVITHAANEVLLTARVQYSAPDAAALEELKRTARLDDEQSGNNIWIGLDGDSVSHRRQRELGWRNRRHDPDGRSVRRRFRHDIELKVPASAHLKLSTVNGGEIAVSGIAGEFKFNNVNGAIDARGLTGFGSAHTVNGPVTVSFAANPTGAVSLKTINGEANLHFLRAPNADFRFKTLNGKILSDFALSATAAAAPPSTELRGVRRVWRTGGFTGGRSGAGGPEIKIETLNGDIHILQGEPTK